MKSPFVKMHYLLVLVVAAAAIAAIAAGGERAPAPVAAEKAGPAAPTAAAGPSEGDLIQGDVLEVINVPSYTYLRVQRGAGQETWAAVPSAAVQVGEHVRVRAQTKMTNFASTSLKRTFASIEFGVLEPGTQAGAAAVAPAAPNPHAAVETGVQLNPHVSGPSSAQALPHVKPGSVGKAAGGYRVEELFARRAELAGKQVRVRGVVVKRTAGVMGKTFAHLRDGSGAEAVKTHDLTITLQEVPDVGQTLLVEGLLEVDRDFGSGYRYDVLVSDAQVIGS